MSSSRVPLILVSLFGIALIWGLFRARTPDGTVATPPAIAEPTPSPPGPRRLSNPSTPSLEAAHAGVEPLPEAPPPDLNLLRPERESLYQELRSETNAVLDEVEAALRPFQATDPATLATAWTLANNWGIFAKGEATADQRIEDPIMRQQLAALHRRVLVESTEEELRAFFGGELPTEIPALVESIGRKHATSASVRKSLPSQADAERRAARRRAASTE